MELNILTGARSIRLLAGHGVRDCAPSAVESGVIVESAGCGEMAFGVAAVAGVAGCCGSGSGAPPIVLGCCRLGSGIPPIVAPLGYVLRKAAHRLWREWERWGCLQVLDRRHPLWHLVPGCAAGDWRCRRRQEWHPGVRYGSQHSV